MEKIVSVKCILILLLIVFCSTISDAQIYSPELKNHKSTLAAPKRLSAPEIETFELLAHLPFEHYSTKNGLPQSIVNTLFIDSKDRLWIGTYGGGAACYDGVQFKIINRLTGLSNNVVWSILEDSDGKIWFGTDQGVSIYDGKKFTYINESNGLESNFVWSLFRDSKNRIWIGTGSITGSVYCVQHGEIIAYNKPDQLPSKQIYAIHEMPDGTMVFGTYKDGIFWLKDSTFFHKHLNSDKANTVIALNSDSLGRLWAGTFDGLHILQDTILLNDSVTKDFIGKRITEIHFGKNATWVSSMSGLACIKNNQTFFYNHQNGMITDELSSVVEDAWGGVWLATANQGLLHLNMNGFSHFPTADNNIIAQTTSLFRDSKNRIWIGTEEGGPVYFHDKKFHRLKVENYTWSMIRCYFEDNTGNIWIGTSHQGIFRFDGKSIVNYSKDQGLVSNSIWTIQQDKYNYIWLGTQWSALKLTDDTVYIFNENNGFAHYQVISSFKDATANLWFGTFGGGVTYYHDNSMTSIRDSHGLTNNSVLAIQTDPFGNIWFSNYGEGISILKSNWLEDSVLTWKKLSMADGLSDENIKSITFDSDSNAWIGGSNGINIVHLMGNNIFNFKPEITHYTYTDGFSGIETLLQGIVFDEHDNVWISSNKELTLFDPSLNSTQQVPPHVYLKNLKLELREVNWDSLPEANFTSIDPWSNIPQNLELPYSLNRLQFEFTGICLDKPKNVEYQWKLNGFEDNWSPWTVNRIATYNNLPPGNFTFELKARNADKIESAVYTYTFIIHKPYWHTWWFRILIGLIITILLILVYKLRTRALMKRQRELEITVENRTKELRHQKDLVEEKQKEIIDSINYAQRIQSAILVNENQIHGFLENIFLLYLPKDIVAGDFYFFEKHNNHLFIAAADCTGHGVPGALVSVICSNALSRCVKEFNIKMPGEILDKSREIIIETMLRSGTSMRDGMDISLVSIPLINDKPGNYLYWAGANNPLWIFDNIDTEHTTTHRVLTPDKQPVGMSDNTISFTTHEVILNHGSHIYLFTDGFADQFGGDSSGGKKYKYKKLAEFIKSISTHDLNQQRDLLEQEFISWKRDLEQVDDICIIGFSW